MPGLLGAETRAGLDLYGRDVIAQSPEGITINSLVLNGSSLNGLGIQTNTVLSPLLSEYPALLPASAIQELLRAHIPQSFVFVGGPVRYLPTQNADGPMSESLLFVLEVLRKKSREEGDRKIEIVDFEHLPVFSEKGSIGLEIISTRPHTQEGTTVISFKYRDTESGNGGRFEITCFIYEEVYVAKENIPQGQMILSENLKKIARPISFFDSTHDLFDFSQGIYEAQRTIQAGQIIGAGDLRNITTVRSGDRIEVQFSKGTVTVVMRGVAQDGGSLGDNIRVRVVDTGRVFSEINFTRI